MRPKFWPFHVEALDAAIVRDADTLIAVWGEAAYETAAKMSWREDTGLISTPRPGHWSRVKREIGSRYGRRDDEPEAAFGAGADRVPVFH